jgi:predicted phosphate transport protein (TIGR00153 family)
MEKRHEWFVQRRKTSGLDLAHEQIIKAFDTVTLLHKATKRFSEGNMKEAESCIQSLYEIEKGVDELRTKVFVELSTGATLLADYREDLLHLVKRADTLADHTKDAARCLEMLYEANIPKELCEKTVLMSGELANMVGVLGSSVEKMSSNPNQAVNEAKRVEEIEHDIDTEYLKTKSLLVKYGQTMNCGAMVIFDDLIEFIEQAADMCADTADYINVLSSRE